MNIHTAEWLEFAEEQARSKLHELHNAAAQPSKPKAILP
jgi:hypothetical protein